ncbi:MAG: TonB-dependent receptor [Cyclobacteriaceae bacterium]|nr:TonB-dependent receptor [Cyclobacteriaceae bacterium]
MKKRIQIVLLVCLASLFTADMFSQVLNVGSAYVPTQDVKIGNKQPLKSALSDLEKQFKVSILSNQELVENQLVDKFDSQDKITVALDKILKAPGLDYKKVSDDFYVIVANVDDNKYANNLSASLSPDAIPMGLVSGIKMDAKISGKIVDEKGEALAGVTIAVVGTSFGTTTSTDGFYELVLGSGTYTLSISFIGYESITKQIAIADQNITFDLILKESIASLDDVVVLGSRSATARTNIDKPVPVDVIQTKEIKAFAQNDITQILNYVAPSFNSNRQTVADGTDHIDPASLRGLGPDQVLVLVNGKRRHTTALVNINGTFGRGSVGTDMNSIPVAAIERVEVLRDGAAAQYGSDAIAGVINLVLKKSSPLTISTTYGQSNSSALGRNFSDGGNFQFDISKGFQLGNKGSINLSGQYLDRGFTNRGGLDTRPLLYSSAPAKGATETEVDYVIRHAQIKALDDAKAGAGGLDRNNMRVGNSDSRNLGFFLNGEYDLAPTATLYAAAGYTNKTGKAAGFYRLPTQASQSDLTIFPNGFLPFINTDINDISVMAGVKGEFGKWNYDVSNAFGRNDIAFNITNTLNASLAVGTSPTQFDAGKLIFQQNTTNLDVSRKFDLSGALSSFNMAYGAELRTDNYQIQAGEERSWSFGQPSLGIAGIAGKAAGAQVFPGFRPSNTLDKSRTNAGLYADFEAEFGPKVLVGAAGRYENYSDFGSNFSYKAIARWKIYKDFSLRGGYSTGFRAPSLHQRFFNNESTQFVQSLPTQVLTVNNDSDVVRQFGVGSLKAEISTSYSLGVAGKLFDRLTFTIDAYQIDIKDRIVFSSQYTRERDAAGNQIPTGKVNQILNTVDPSGVINSVQFFTNAISTQTRGLDIVLSDKFDVGSKGNKLIVTAAANFNETKVESINGSDVIESDPTLKAKLFDRLERSRYEMAVPKNKINLSVNYTSSKWNILLRSVQFGEVGYLNAVDPAIPTNNLPLEIDQNFTAKWITDISISYKIIKSINFTVGANNLFDVYPDKAYIDPRNNEQNLASSASGTGYTTGRDNTSNGRFLYSRNVSQFGFNGRFVFAKVTFSL